MKKVPIIGIGASAGGLKELECFFKNMPSSKEVAFVIIQHLSPNYKSLLADIVTRYTEMAVSQIENNTRVEAGKVYIIPPGKLLSLNKEKFILTPMPKDKGIHLPIDVFFRSLKDNLGEEAVAVILSGTGSDGTLGIKEVKEAGGLTIVQQPDTADYDGMPTSAIKTGLIDFVIPVEEMPKVILNYIENEFKELKLISTDDKTLDSYITQIFDLVKNQTGNDFTSYKRNTIYRRIERRLAVNKLTNLHEYVELLKNNSTEVGILYKEFLISVTNFFRDIETFEYFEQNLISDIVGKLENNNLRIWIPACATGEEAYSWSILFKNYIDDNKLNIDLQIFASDIDVDAIDKAREGFYTNNIVSDVPKNLLERYFSKEKDGYRIKKSIRETVIFAEQNLIQDPPYSRLDMVSCRNLLIYLDHELQQKAIAIAHYALNTSGILVLGNSETLGNAARNFKILDRKLKIFQKIDNIDVSNRVLKLNYDRQQGKTTAKKITPDPISEIAKEHILDRHTPPSVVIDRAGNMLYAQGRTGKYLEIVTGEISTNIIKTAKEGLKIPLTNAIRKININNQEITHTNIRVKSNNEYEYVDLTISPLYHKQKETKFFIVLFQPSKLVSKETGNIEDKNTEHLTIIELEKELAEKEQFLQNTIEELETTNEELKSSNEEAQSTNQELQSTNEELETSKEELQSVNEELTTTNNELSIKIDELNKVNSQIKNLLSATNIATIFLDKELRIFNFTPAISIIIDLLPSDIGRSIKQFTNNLKYEKLVDDAKEVLRTLIPKETEVQNVDNKYFWMRMLPYRTIDDRIDGIVITFTDISEKKKQELELEKYRNHLEQLVEEKSKDLLDSEALLNQTGEIAKIGGWHYNVETEKLIWTKELYRIHDVPFDFVLTVEKGIAFYEGESRKIIERAFNDALTHKKSFDLELRIISGKQVTKDVRAIGEVIEDQNGKVVSVKGSFQDITEKKKAEQVIAEQFANMQSVLENTESMISLRDKNGKLMYYNKPFAEIVKVLFKTEAYVGMKTLELQSLEIQEQWKPIWANVLNGNTYKTEFLWDYENGEKRYYELFCHPVVKGNETIGFLEITRDITERKKSEQKIRESEETIRTMTEHIPGLFSLVDVNGPILYTSPLWNKFLGEESLIGKHFSLLYKAIHPDDLAIIRSKQDAPFKGFELELRMTTVDGIERWFHFYSYPISDSVGNITRLAGFGNDITEKKKAEQALKENEEFLQNITDNIPALVGVINKNYEYIFVNKPAETFFGKSKNEIIGKHVKDVIGENAFKRAYSYTLKAFGGETVTYENNLQSQDHSLLFTQNTLQPFYKNNEISGILVLNVDITALKQAEKELTRINSELKLTNELLERIGEMAKVGGWELDLETLQETYSLQTLLIHEFDLPFTPPEALQGIEFYPPEVRPVILAAIKEAIESGTPYEFEAPFITAKGRNKWVRVQGFVVRENNKTTKLRGTIQDITERKQAEQKLLDNQHFLQKAQEIGSIGTWHSDFEKNIFTWTDENYKIFGIPIGTPINYERFLECVHPDDRDYVQAEWIAAIAGKTYDIEHRIVVDGNIKWVREKAELVFDANQKPTAAFGVSQNITYKKQVEEELKKKATELYELNQDKDKFISILAHDLKNPFNVLLGFSDLLAKNIRKYDLEKIEQKAIMINATANQTYEMLDSILLWSRAHAGKISYHPALYNLNDICKSVLDIVSNHALSKEISILQNLPSELIVFADNEMLKTILRNLLTNAIKFTEPKGSVSIQAEKQQHEVVVSVKDTGVGMTTDMLNSLFSINAVTTSQGTSNEKGSGLGLLICKEFAEIQGGRIWAESESGKGSVFYVTIPLSANKTVVANDNDTENKSNKKSNFSILIAEDEFVNYQYLEILIQDELNLVCEIYHAKNGLEAVEVTKNRDFDLVLMDIKMPLMDGFEATKQIKSIKPDTKIVIQSANSEQQNIEIAKGLGCADFLIKPIKLKQLKTILENQLLIKLP